MKRVLTLTLVLLLIAVPVFAATGDIYKSDGTPFMSAIEFLTNREAIEAYIDKPENFLTEIDGLLYKADDIKKAFEKDQGNYIEALKKSGAGIPKGGEELRVLDVKISMDKTSATVSLSREASLEELGRLTVKPEGTFEKVEGKKATLKFKESIRKGQEIEVGGFLKKFEGHKTVYLELDNISEEEFKGLEFIGADVGDDSFLEKLFLSFEDSFVIKNNSEILFRVESGEVKKVVKKGDEFSIKPEDNSTLKISKVKITNPASLDFRFLKAKETEDGETSILSIGNTSERCKMKEGTRVTVTAKRDSTTLTIFDKTYHESENCLELKEDLESLTYDGKWIYKYARTELGSATSPTNIFFKTNKELYGFVITGNIENSDNTNDQYLKNGWFNYNEKNASRATLTTSIGPNNNTEWKNGTVDGVYKVIIRERSEVLPAEGEGEIIFEGILKTAAADRISKAEWEALNAFTNGKNIKFWSNSGGLAPGVVTSNLYIEFGSEYKGFFTVEFKGWYEE